MVDGAGVAPSAALAAAIAAVDVSGLDSFELVDLIAEWERVAGWVQASQNQAYAALSRIMVRHPEPSARGFSHEVHTLGLSLAVSTATIEARLAQASTLVESMPAVQAALAAGQITAGHARAAAQAVVNATDVTAAAVDRVVMGERRSGWHTPGQLERQIARAILEVDPSGARARRRAAVKDRDVRFHDLPDGMGSMSSTLAVEDARAMAARLDAEARASAAHPDSSDDHRTLAQRRADALVALVTGLAPSRPDRRDGDAGSTVNGRPAGAASSGKFGEDPADAGAGDDVAVGDDVTAFNEPEPESDPKSDPESESEPERGPAPTGLTVGDGANVGGAVATAHDDIDAFVTTGAASAHNPDGPLCHGRRPAVNVTVAWTTLMGLDDAPADLTGYGPIDADTARRIAADPTATWRRLLVEPTSGRLLDVGRRRYRPPRDLAEFVLARDVSCRYPTCDRAAVTCDIDHRQRWRRGGHTADVNLDALCRHHHRMKDKYGWHHERHPDTDASCWQSPRGDTATKVAASHPVERDIGPPPF